MSDWEEELHQYFPSYLLPSAEVKALPREAAARFLARITGKPEALDLLLAQSALASVVQDIHDLDRELPLLSRELPSRTEPERVERDGSVQGRLDPMATAQRRMAGLAARVVANTPRPTYARPENELLVAAAERAVGLLRKLETGGVISASTKKSWARGLTDVRRNIADTLRKGPLSQVPRVPVAELTAHHEGAARVARHAAYALALRIHRAMRCIDEDDAARIAQLVADHALAPIEAPRRFEIAVLIRLGRALEAALGPRGFTMERALVHRDRREVFGFHRGTTSLRVYYDQSVLPHACKCDEGMRHYLGDHGTLRPDITLDVIRDGARARAALVDAKLSDDPGYLETSYLKMRRYQADLAAHLGGWPMVTLVASSGRLITGAPRREDAVIAVPWKSWVPEEVVAGFVDGL